VNGYYHKWIRGLCSGNQFQILVTMFQMPAMFFPALAASLFNEDSPHCFGCGGKELGAIFKL